MRFILHLWRSLSLSCVTGTYLAHARFSIVVSSISGKICGDGSSVVRLLRIFPHAILERRMPEDDGQRGMDVCGTRRDMHAREMQFTIRSNLCYVCFSLLCVPDLFWEVFVFVVSHLKCEWFLVYAGILQWSTISYQIGPRHCPCIGRIMGITFDFAMKVLVPMNGKDDVMDSKEMLL